MSVELDFSLESRHMLTMALVSKSPESSFPNETGLGVLQSHDIFIINTSRLHEEVEIGNIEPIADHKNSCNQRPYLKPTFRVNIVECPIRVSLEGSPYWETVRSILLSKKRKCVNDIRSLH